MVCALSFVEEGFVGLVTLFPKERVFWEPFVAGPFDVRVRRVAGIAARIFQRGLYWFVEGSVVVVLGGDFDDEGWKLGSRGNATMEAFHGQAATTF
jgi:hypothetical protein